MPFFIVTGKLGGGKSLVTVSKIKEALLDGRRVATNLNIFIEHMLPPDVRKIDLTRLPDIPTVHDLEALGQGSDVYGDEDKFGVLVLDEASGMFNSRLWSDQGRQAMIDWLKHSRKLRWTVFIIAQTDGMLDKQIREAFGEHLVVCKRMDRLAIPVIGLLGKLAGFKIKPPKVHVGIVRYGLGPRDPVVDRWFYRGHGLYKAYDTEQKFDVATSPGRHCYLPPFAVVGHKMNKFQIARVIASTYVVSALLVGAMFSWGTSWWIYKGSQNELLKNGSATLNKFKTTDVETTVSIDGVMFVDNLVIAYLSDGKVVRTTEFARDDGGLRVKVGSKWIYKKD